MYEMADLEKAFGTVKAPPAPRVESHAPVVVTPSYELRLASLLKAEGGRYGRCLGGSHDYPSDSEASLAVVDAMVARHFTDGEIWRTLESSQLYVRRVEKKGETHARRLYSVEIAKGRQSVQPFRKDPGRMGAKGAPPRRQLPGSYLPSPANGNGDGSNREQGSPPLAWPKGQDFISRYVRYASQRTDAPLEAHELMAVGVLSALAGPTPRLPIATSRRGWSLCIWCMYVVNSTTGRKTTTINLGREVIIEVLGQEAIIEWEGSPQGLIQRLQERDGQAAVFARDEYSGLMAQMNRAGGHLAGLPQLFIKAFDGGVLENIRTKKKVTKDGPKVEDTDRVENPYLVKLAASTWDSFMERCTIDNVLDGFLARFVFVTGAAEPRPLPLITAAMMAEFDAVVDHARAFSAKAEAAATLEVQPAVINLAWQLEQRWLRQAEQSSHPDAAGPSMKRLAEAVLKTAALLAIDEAKIGAPVCLTPEHFTRAAEMGERWRRGNLAVIEALGSTSFMRDTEAVLKSIAACPGGVTVRDLMRKHRRLRQRDFEEILATLETREQIEVLELKSKRGRASRIAYPFGHAPQSVVDDA